MKPVKTTYKDRIEWRVNDKLHRTDGPAIEYAHGDKIWFRNGKRHRTDGPAVEHANGDKFWYKNGKPHRTDGPAVEYTSGYKEWWFNGKWLSEYEWLIKTGKENKETLSKLMISLANSNYISEAEEIAMLCIMFDKIDNKQRIYDRAKELRKLL